MQLARVTAQQLKNYYSVNMQNILDIKKHKREKRTDAGSVDNSETFRGTAPDPVLQSRKMFMIWDWLKEFSHTCVLKSSFIVKKRGETRKVFSMLHRKKAVTRKIVEDVASIFK